MILARGRSLCLRKENNMSIRQVSPYINFEGNSEQAIRHYERTLGAKVERLVRYGEVPDNKFAPELQNRVMHCELRIGDGVVMLSDAMGGMGPTAAAQIALDFSDAAELTARFDALAKDGKTLFPVHDTWYGGKFGMLTDVFGVRWMLNLA